MIPTTILSIYYFVLFLFVLGKFENPFIFFKIETCKLFFCVVLFTQAVLNCPKRKVTTTRDYTGIKIYERK